MVGKIIGTAAFLSLLALVWLLLWRTGFTPWTIAIGMLVFLCIGAFATVNTADWQRRSKKP